MDHSVGLVSEFLIASTLLVLQYQSVSKFLAHVACLSLSLTLHMSMVKARTWRAACFLELSLLQRHQRHVDPMLCVQRASNKGDRFLRAFAGKDDAATTHGGGWAFLLIAASRGRCMSRRAKGKGHGRSPDEDSCRPRFQGSQNLRDQKDPNVLQNVMFSIPPIPR